MEKNNKHGGKRENSGRKKINPDHKKIRVVLYLENIKIENHGGMENFKKYIYEKLF
jgi:hypothetical protein